MCARELLLSPARFHNWCIINQLQNIRQHSTCQKQPFEYAFFVVTPNLCSAMGAKKQCITDITYTVCYLLCFVVIPYRRIWNKTYFTGTGMTIYNCSSASKAFQSLYSLSGRTYYRMITRRLEAARFGFRFFESLWHLTGTSAAALSRYLSNFRAIRSLWHPISQLRDFTRFGGKVSYCLVNRIPG